jgi:uncharacterized membrane-anchored protein YhcB (DUF1043 family)
MALLRVVGTVIVVVVALAYGALFISWNPTIISVVGLGSPVSQKMVEELPVWSLPFIGGVVGVFVMLFSMWALWAGQKRQTDKYKRQVEKAKRIIAERNGTIEEHEAKIAQLEADLATASQQSEHVGEESLTEEQPGSQVSAATELEVAAEDDDEVI